MKKKYILSSLAILLLAGCGSESQPGFVALQVDASRVPDGFSQEVSVDTSLSGLNTIPSNDLVVQKFRITISGPNINPALVQEVSASETQIRIMGIEPGEARSIRIEALNARGQVIRRREVGDVTITAGVTTPIRTRLHTVPVILNLQDGATISTGRLQLLGFGEPGTTIHISSQQGAQSILLNQNVDESPIVVSPSRSTGVFEFVPPQLPRGYQTLIITDQITQESSEVRIFALNGQDRPGRFLSSRSTTSLSVGRAGGSKQGIHQPLILKELQP